MTKIQGLDLSGEELIQTFQSARVLVAGDVMLDRYWFGDTTRISPEAPVPVTKIEHTEHRAGGAANVARNVAALGGKTTLISVTGDDEAALVLRNLMDDARVNFCLVADAAIRTTIKLRVIARNQQLIRLDFENRPNREILRQIICEYKKRLPENDVVVLSDYGKGGLTHVTELIDLAREAGKPVLIDPKGDDYLRYRNATMITPNLNELRCVVGCWDNEEALYEKAQQLRKSLCLKDLLLTRSEEGLSLFYEGGVEHQATRAREVYDVSGAGDTVIAGMALSLAAGLNERDAMKIANAAAGVVVAKVGTAVCSPEELLAQKSFVSPNEENRKNV